MFSEIIRMTEGLAVNQKIAANGRDEIISRDYETYRLIDLVNNEEDLGATQNHVSKHVKFSSVFAIFGSLIFGEWPFARTGAVKSVGEFGDDKNHKSDFGGSAINI